MTKHSISVVLIVALTLPGCAATSGGRLQTSATVTRTQADRTWLADFVQKLPIGSRVRVHVRDGSRERGTLMDATAERIILQRRTRIPEPPIEIPLDRVTSVELENGGGSVVKAVGIGIAAGAGAIVGIMLVLAAIYAD